MRPSSQPRERIPERRGLGKILDHRILSLFWRRPYLVLLPFIVLAFRSTLINGLIYPLRNTRFKGDFSAALFDGAQLGYCYPTSPDHIDPMGIVQTREGIWVSYEFSKSIDIFYGPLFTLFQRLAVDYHCLVSKRLVVAEPHLNPDTVLLGVTWVNIILVLGSGYLLFRILGSNRQLIAVIATLWLLDTHLSYGISVAAIPEFSELFLLLVVVVMIDRRSASADLWSGLLLGVALTIKLVPLIFAPLLLLEPRGSIRRVSAFVATVGSSMVAASIGFGLSIIEVTRQTFIPPTAGITPEDDFQFHSLSSAVTRVFHVEPNSSAGTMVGLLCTVVILALYAFAVVYTFVLRRRHAFADSAPDPSRWLLFGLYFSLLPMINIAHIHTYVFLIPAYGFACYGFITVFDRQIAIRLIGSFVVIYLWISQYLVVNMFQRLGLGNPSLLYEEAFATLGLSLLFVVSILLHNRNTTSGTTAPPGAGLTDMARDLSD